MSSDDESGRDDSRDSRDNVSRSRDDSREESEPSEENSRDHSQKSEGDSSREVMRRKRSNPGAKAKKYVAKSMKNAEFQEKRNGDLAVLFFRESCPYCREFKPVWNRVSRELPRRWMRDSLVYDEDKGTVAKVPEVRRVDVTKFEPLKKSIGFPTVPMVGLYKRDKPVVFLTTENRALHNILKLVENYYKRNQLPPTSECVIGTTHGTWPREVQEKKEEKIDELKPPTAEKIEKSIEMVPAAQKMETAFSAPQRLQITAPRQFSAPGASVKNITRHSADTQKKEEARKDEEAHDVIFAKLLAKLFKNKQAL